MKITFSAKLATAPDTLVVGAFEGRKLSHDAAEIDRRTKGALKKAMSAGRFTGAMEQFVDIVAPIGVAARRIVIAGLGKQTALDALALQNIGGAMVAHLNRVGAKRAAVPVEKWANSRNVPVAGGAANLASRARRTTTVRASSVGLLSAFSFVRYLSKR